MSEWLKEHAWKAKRASDTETLRSASTLTRSATYPSETITRCPSVNLDVLRGFEPDVSHSYHNRFAHLRRLRRYRSASLYIAVNPRHRSLLGEHRLPESVVERGWLSTVGQCACTNGLLNRCIQCRCQPAYRDDSLSEGGVTRNRPTSWALVLPRPTHTRIPCRRWTSPRHRVRSRHSCPTVRVLRNMCAARLLVPVMCRPSRDSASVTE